MSRPRPESGTGRPRRPRRAATARAGATAAAPRRSRPRAGPALDRHDLYERCVQSPRHLVGLILAIHGGDPKVLGEDFSGTGAVSRAWVSLVKGGRAIAVDRDAAVLARARARGVRRLRGDVLTATDPVRDAADVIVVGNFSIGEIHDRRRLIRYLRHCRERLRARGGVFICDTYGGESAFRTGAVHRIHPGPDGSRIRYTWEQRAADPLTGMVENALHFRVERGGWIVQEDTDAFIYRWRLWSIPELREAMREAGFRSTAVYDQAPDALDHEGRAYTRPIDDPRALDPSFIVCIAART